MLPDTFIAPPCHEQIGVLYEDEHILLINKPTGLLSLSGKNPLNKDSVHYRLVQHYPSAIIVHRLDFGTSGVMVVALNKEVTVRLSKQFEMRTVEKNYQAIVLGDLDDDQGEINAPLGKANFPYQKVCTVTGKQAQTHFKVLQRYEDSLNGITTTRVELNPLTGRTHQLRIHCRELGHPIIGCDLYGLVLDEIDSQTLSERLMLHATSLMIKHPITGEQIHQKVDAPF